MRDYIFHGKRVDNGEWVEGYLCYNKARKQYYIMDDVNAFPIPVHKESVGQYTGFDEWMLDDASRDAKLYEGDIIEVWCNREIYGSPWSTHDGKIKFTTEIIAAIRENKTVDFKNKYNEAICKAKGKEEYDRDVPWGYELYRNYFNHLNKDREEYRKKQVSSWTNDDEPGIDDARRELLNKIKENQSYR